MLAFTVQGEPIPWERTDTNGTRRYTPIRTRDWKATIANVARRAGAGVPKLLEGPIRLTGRFYRESWQRCDLDNLEKALKDALNAVAWVDDSQVCAHNTLKAVDAANPRMEIEIEELLPTEEIKGFALKARALPVRRNARLAAIQADLAGDAESRRRAHEAEGRLVSSVRRHTE